MIESNHDHHSAVRRRMSSSNKRTLTPENKTLHAGEYHVAQHPAILSTLLGSCVSVCLYDPTTRIIGMNHFLLATQHPSAEAILESEAGRYGMGAMELLINAMLKKGARRAQLKAKAFGGGNVLATHLQELPARFSIGKLNIEFVRRYLREDGIPLVAQDFGGVMGRHIRFDSEDYSVYMRRIPIRNAANIAIQEKQYFNKTLRNQQTQRNVDFW